jgi:hypothetical protein
MRSARAGIYQESDQADSDPSITIHHQRPEGGFNIDDRPGERGERQPAESYLSHLGRAVRPDISCIETGHRRIGLVYRNKASASPKLVKDRHQPAKDRRRIFPLFLTKSWKSARRPPQVGRHFASVLSVHS